MLLCSRVTLGHLAKQQMLCLEIRCSHIVFHRGALSRFFKYLGHILVAKTQSKHSLRAPGGKHEGPKVHLPKRTKPKGLKGPMGQI